MQFSVMPDRLFGASVRINGTWVGIVEEQPVRVKIADAGTSYLLVELSPLTTDPTGDVYPLPLARVIRIRDGEIVPPEVEQDGFLHIRRAGQAYEIYFVYPKVEALDACYETMPMQLQTETADFDRDGRLDTVQTLATNRCGHVRVRAASGTLLLQEVFPDNQLRVEVVDLNRDGRPEVLIFWQQQGAIDPLQGCKVQHWDPASGAIAAYEGFTGVRRIGRGEVLFERRQQTPYWQVIRLFQYTRQEGQSAQFLPVRTEEKMLLRAESKADAVEAFLGALELGDTEGVRWYTMTNYMTLPELKRVLGHFYAHEIVRIEGHLAEVKLFEWIAPGYYDRERSVRLELFHLPEQESEWKIGRAMAL